MREIDQKAIALLIARIPVSAYADVSNELNGALSELEVLAIVNDCLSKDRFDERRKTNRVNDD